MGFFVNKIVTYFWTLFYYIFGRYFFSGIGRKCRFEGWIDVPQRGGFLIIGDGVHICRRVIFTVTNNATLSLGSNTFIGPGVVISAHQKILIGSNCLIAEYVSIYDNDHVTTDVNKPISKQGYISEPCVIGDGCWIGAGARILRGASLGKDCILGAGSILKRVIPERAIAVGVPARVIKNRPHTYLSSMNSVSTVE